jgi:hypothetical protein
MLLLLDRNVRELFDLSLRNEEFGFIKLTAFECFVILVLPRGWLFSLLKDESLPNLLLRLN